MIEDESRQARQKQDSKALEFPSQPLWKGVGERSIKV